MQFLRKQYVKGSADVLRSSFGVPGFKMQVTGFDSIQASIIRERSQQRQITIYR